MSIRSLIAASRSGHALTAATISQAASRAHQHAAGVPPLLPRLGPLARAFSSSPETADVDSGVPVMEVQKRRVGKKAKGAKSGKAMMFPLHFHYEDVLREDLLLKLNHTNTMEVPGLFEIRLVPKSTTGAKIQFGKLAMEILCGQRCIQAELPAHLKGKATNAYLGSQKDAVSLRQSIIRGHGMYNFLVRVLTVMSMLDSKVAIEQGNCVKFFMATEFCEFSPEIEDHFEIFETIGGFNVTIVTTACSKEETSLLWSGFLLKDEGEIS
ncbi:60S ribosomal protein L5, mitochondrial-like [Triticum dicoccoides]|uniref:60S ribosomal protein L5, mitochondrial-like n=1 Tax=Triticum dicoccoides TaxID=85692 RepID=UPI000E7BDEDE|nr:60S ribosomal protein L5, mitochondrial-like [Triticum dicoccoides]